MEGWFVYLSGRRTGSHTCRLTDCIQRAWCCLEVPASHARQNFGLGADCAELRTEGPAHNEWWHELAPPLSFASMLGV